jgi:hypothetical protein
MPRKKKVQPIIETIPIINENIHQIDNNIIDNNIIDNNVIDNNVICETVVTKSKRGRKPKNALLMNIKNENNENTILSDSVNLHLEVEEFNGSIMNETDEIDNDDINENETPTKPIGKKRGRKPKGGKIIQNILPVSNIKENKPNIILHLKCSNKDLLNNLFENNNNNINGYDLSSKKDFLYEIISSNDGNITNNYENTTNLNSLKSQQCQENINIDYCDNECYPSNKNSDLKDLWKKLKNLQHCLHLNNINDKKSACFWCTYEFDNPPIYIPKHYIKESYHVYGCFCSPECATAFLMEENIDSSTKFERYHLLNHIYSKIYDYKKNIKPAPKPHYVLEKFYGNLNIQEYRSLLKNERLFLVVDKPLTRILPELHEDNDDFIINNKIIPSNTYQIKRKILQKQNKTNILSEKFGLQQNT